MNHSDPTGHSWKSICGAISQKIVRAVAKAAKIIAKASVKTAFDLTVKKKVETFRYYYKKAVTGTVSITANASGAFGAAGTLSVGYAFDHNGNLGFVFSAGAGGGMPSTSATIGITVTNAPELDKLLGLGVQAGGSVAVGAHSVGLDAVIFRQPEGEVYEGVGASFGYGAKMMPMEFHVYAMNSSVHYINIFGIIDKVYDAIDSW